MFLLPTGPLHMPFPLSGTLSPSPLCPINCCSSLRATKALRDKALRAPDSWRSGCFHFRKVTTFYILCSLFCSVSILFPIRVGSNRARTVCFSPPLYRMTQCSEIFVSWINPMGLVGRVFLFSFFFFFFFYTRRLIFFLKASAWHDFYIIL